VVFRTVLLACALVIGACGDSQPADPEKRTAGGVQAEERFFDQLGVRQVKTKTPITACGGDRVELVEVRGRDAIATWRALRDRARSSGRWPVLIGGPDEGPSLADMLHWNCKDGYTFERTLARASKLDLDDALARVARAYGVRARDLRGSTPLPDAPASDEFYTPLDLATEEPLPKVRIALLPIDASWKAPAYLAFGHYNDNPPPPVHTALLREWNRRYGTEVVSLTGSVIELWVAHPPTTDEAALAIAREQYRYAPDIVQQGTGDVETLAALLKDGHAWFFWWD
jgi:uncharacterized protein DUF4253